MRQYPRFPSRNVHSLDGLWNFSFRTDVAMEEVDVSAVEADDKTAVPGCFDTSPDHYGKHGLGLYVRNVDIEADGRYRIRFDGLGLYARVYWDGAPVAECRLPYSTFEVDLVAARGTHRLAVLAGNCYWEKEWSPLYRTGDDYYAFGGIYRSVTIERLPDGPFLERVQVFTADLAKRTVRLRFLFGGAVADGPAEAVLAVPGGQVWSPASPRLHTLTAAFRGDAVVERFGLRTIATSGETILLNGEKIYLQGFNRHESHPEFGPVQTDQLMLDDLKWLRDIGANYIRAVHYQQDPRFLELCDELGFLVWEESAGWGVGVERLAAPWFAPIVVEQNRRMIRSGINNPCVIFWSFLNEAANDEPGAVPLYETAVAEIRREDPSRLVSYCNWMNQAQARCLELCDVISYHMYPGWFGGAPERDLPASATIPKAVADSARDAGARDCCRGKPAIVSEIGACGIYGMHDRDLAQWTEEFEADYDSVAVDSILATPRFTGFTIWQFIDSKSYTRGSAIRSKTRGFNNAGLLDEYRRPKLAYYALRERLRAHRA